MKFANVEFVAFDSADVIATSLWFSAALINELGESLTIASGYPIDGALYYGIDPDYVYDSHAGRLTVNAFKSVDVKITPSEKVTVFEEGTSLDTIYTWLFNNRPQ